MLPAGVQTRLRPRSGRAGEPIFEARENWGDRRVWTPTAGNVAEPGSRKPGRLSNADASGRTLLGMCREFSGILGNSQDSSRAACSLRGCIVVQLSPAGMSRSHSSILLRFIRSSIRAVCGAPSRCPFCGRLKLFGPHLRSASAWSMAFILDVALMTERDSARAWASNASWRARELRLWSSSFAALTHPSSVYQVRFVPGVLCAKNVPIGTYSIDRHPPHPPPLSRSCDRASCTGEGGSMPPETVYEREKRMGDSGECRSLPKGAHPKVDAPTRCVFGR